MRNWTGSGTQTARYAQGGVDQPVAESRSGTTAFYEQDGIGSVTSLSNTAGTLSNTYTYDTFGNLTASSGSLGNPFQYTGRDFDVETGLRYYRARYYDPATGRFLSEDPIQFLNGPNFYAYVGNDPIDRTDPWDLRTEVILWNPVGVGESSFGHISVVINGVSYSWGPSPGRDPRNKCCKPGKMDIRPADQFISNNTKFRTGLGYILNLTPAQENAFIDYVKNFKGNYNVVDRNCGDPVVSGLEAIGIHLNLSHDPITALPPLVIMPDDLDYAFGHTPGLVGGWLPHPQVSPK